MKAVILCALLASMCTPAVPKREPSPAPAPAPTATVTIPDPPSATDAGPDPIALELCAENFEALNPDLTRAQVIELFCTGPEALAPWELRAASKRAH